jgi:hypothetical protein
MWQRSYAPVSMFWRRVAVPREHTRVAVRARRTQGRGQMVGRGGGRAQMHRTPQRAIAVRDRDRPVGLPLEKTLDERAVGGVVLDDEDQLRTGRG